MKIWNKDNILIEKFSGSFDKLKLDKLPLIKIPNYNSKYFFYVLIASFNWTKFSLITSESIDSECNMPGYYEITTDFDKDTPIELYDSESKIKIKTITLKDLYKYWLVLSGEFAIEAHKELAMITVHLDDQTVIKYIGKIHIRRDDVLSIEHFLGNDDLVRKNRDICLNITYHQIRDRDITIQILNDKDSLIHAINEIGDENIIE